MFLHVIISAKKKYRYHDLILTVESKDYFGYITDCLKKITVLKQKDNEDYEKFCRTVIVSKNVYLTLILFKLLHC